MSDNECITTVDISDASKANTLQYFSETSTRAFSDHRDGLKPVHRLILFTLEKLKAYQLTKVAKLVGAVLEFHPHGDSSVYSAMVRLAQPWIMNYPLIYGKGNWGTQDGDTAAAGRYIEAKLSDFAREVITDDLNSTVVDFTNNFDYRSMVPVYLPTRVPLALINGISGIGVGFTDNIPPHNLSEIVDRCIQYIKNKNIPNDVLCEGLYPDFPTGGEILNGDEVAEFYKRGTPCSIQIRGKAKFDTDNNMIILYEFPYNVAVDDIEKAVQNEIKNGNMVLSGIESIIDNNNHNKKIIEDAQITKKTFEYQCKKDANMIEILNEICRVSNFKTSISLSFMTMEGGYPKYVTVKDIIADWYRYRFDVIRRLHTRNIASAQEKLHLYEGILSIYDRKKEVIKFLSESKAKDKEETICQIHETFGLTKTQARGVYEMPLGTLSSFGKSDLENRIANLKRDILQDDYILTHIDATIIKDLNAIKEKYGRPRRTTILKNFQMKTSDRPVISKGAFIYSHTQLGLYDVNGCRDSKGILTGLRPWKGMGKGIREIVGGTQLEGSPIGFIVAYSNGTIQLVDSSVFRVLNVWYDTKCDEKDIKTIITAACPIYKESDELICLSSDGKIKRIASSSISKRAVSSGGTIIRMARHDVESEVLDCLFTGFYDDKGAVYTAIPIEEIPQLERSSAGVKCPIECGEINILPIDMGDGSDDNRVFVATCDSAGLNYMHSIPVNSLKIQSRANKPKLLGLPKDQTVTSLSEGKIVDKDQILCMIGKGTSSTLSVINFKKPFSEKKLFLTVMISQLF